MDSTIITPHNNSFTDNVHISKSNFSYYDSLYHLEEKPDHADLIFFNFFLQSENNLLTIENYKGRRNNVSWIEWPYDKWFDEIDLGTL